MAAAVREPGRRVEHRQPSWPWQIHRDVRDHVAWARREDDHPVGQEDRLRHRVRDEQDGRRGLGPDTQQLEAEALPGQGVEGAERLVEQGGRTVPARAPARWPPAGACRRTARADASRRSRPCRRAPAAQRCAPRALVAACRQARAGRRHWRRRRARGAGAAPGRRSPPVRPARRRSSHRWRPCPCRRGAARRRSAAACSCRSRSAPGWRRPDDRRPQGARRRGRAAVDRRSTRSCARGR